MVLGGGVLLTMLGVIAFVAVLSIEHRMSTTLPVPTGPYSVGRIHLTWSRRGDRSAPHDLLVWLWYPAAAKPTAATSRYLPGEMGAAIQHQRGWLFGGLLTRDLSKVRAHAVDGAPLAVAPGKFPVLLLRGGASAAVWNYTTLAEDLASHGYVVVGFDVPYRTDIVVRASGEVDTRLGTNDPEALAGRHDDAGIQRLIDVWARDLGGALDELERLNQFDPSGRFQGRLDLHRVGALGHSFGGTEVAQFCAIDPRCRAGIDIDGGMFGNTAQLEIKQPFLFLLSDHRREHGREAAEILWNMQAVYGRLPTATRGWVVLPGANHFFFSDDSALLKSHLVIGALRLLGIVRIDGPQQLALTANAVRSFFDANLGTRGSAGAGAGVIRAHP